jgi:hypothetical protein
MNVTPPLVHVNECYAPSPSFSLFTAWLHNCVSVALHFFYTLFLPISRTHIHTHTHTHALTHKQHTHWHTLAESGGIIAITTNGEYAMEFNSKGMFRAVCKYNSYVKHTIQYNALSWTLKSFNSAHQIYISLITHLFCYIIFCILHSMIGDSTGNCSVGIWQDMIPFHVNAQGKPSVIVTGYSEKMEMTEAISNKEFGLQWSNRQ